MLIAAKIVRVDPAGRLPVIAHSQRVTSDRMDMAVFPTTNRVDALPSHGNDDRHAAAHLSVEGL
jgi:hypothetical protein